MKFDEGFVEGCFIIQALNYLAVSNHSPTSISSILLFCRMESLWLSENSIECLVLRKASSSSSSIILVLSFACCLPQELKGLSMFLKILCYQTVELIQLLEVLPVEFSLTPRTQIQTVFERNLIPNGGNLSHHTN